MSIKYPVIRSSMPPMQEYIREIEPLWHTRWLTNRGEKACEFERRAGELLDAPHCVSCVNGHQALELALDALELTGEIITTPFTFVSTTAAIVRRGLTPVFCDVREDDFTLDPEKLEVLITEKTSAILPVHVYGNICQTDRLAQIAQKHGLKLIYDAAHAFGARHRGRGAGALGDVSMFSLHATKVMHSIEGGLLTCSDPALAEKLRRLQNFGLADAQTAELAGTNAKMNEFQAAMGLCNLRHLEEYIAARKCAYARYAQRLEGLAGVRINAVAPDTQSNYAYFPILVDPERTGVDRDRLADALAARGVGTRKYFAPLTSDFARYVRWRGDTPVAGRAARQVLTLPLYDGLSPEDVDEICDAVWDCLADAR